MSSLKSLLEDHYDDPYHHGSCERASHVGERGAENGRCQLRIELSVNADGVIEEAWFDGAGCQICESLASILMERCEGDPVDQWSKMTMEQLLDGLASGSEKEVEADRVSGDPELVQTGCVELPLQVLKIAFERPAGSDVDDGADTTTFGGPSLREEC